MADKIKAPSVPVANPEVPVDPSAGKKAAVANKPDHSEGLPDAYQKAAQGLLGYKSSPLMSGAYKIFSDGIVFPPNLLNTADPKNDANYLRLLAAIWGMDDLEKYFETLTEEKELKRKIERDERQRKKKEEAELDSEKEDEEESD